MIDKYFNYYAEQAAHAAKMCGRPHAAAYTSTLLDWIYEKITDDYCDLECDELDLSTPAGVLSALLGIGDGFDAFCGFFEFSADYLEFTDTEIESRLCITPGTRTHKELIIAQALACAEAAAIIALVAAQVYDLPQK